MNVENIMALCIMSLVALIFMGIGISQFKSKVPVGFYTGEKPPKAEELIDVKGWNRGHGAMWCGYGVMIMISWLSAVFVEHETVSMVLTFVILIGGLLGMILGHHLLRKKYFVKKHRVSLNGMSVLK